MKKTGKILGIVLIVIAALALIGFAVLKIALPDVSVESVSYFLQKENVESMQKAKEFSSAELEDQIAENRQKVQTAIETSPDLTVRDLTDEEKQALADGTVTNEELIGRLTAPAEDPLPETEDEKPADPPTKPAEENTYQKKLSSLVAEVYILRETYTASLAKMEEDIRSEFSALPKAEQTRKNALNIAQTYLANAYRLERDCDREIDRITDEMEALIRANDGDMTIVDTVFESYIQEKSLKKAWYISKLEERGISK